MKVISEAYVVVNLEDVISTERSLHKNRALRANEPDVEDVTSLL